MTFFEVSTTSTEVAHSAHAGGFLFGAAVAYLLRRAGVDSQLDEAAGLAAEKGQDGWSEHPLYLEALTLRERAQDGAAIEKLIELCALAPDHVAAREELLALGMHLRNLHAVDLALPALVGHYQKTRADKPLVAIYERLRQALPEYGLTDQELLRVATAGGHLNDAALVISCVSELLTQHPNSPLQPRAMWLAAQTQAQSGQTALQRDTMQRIVSRFPSHACATLAREQLGRLEAAG
jgi:hypothetical protein